MGDLPTELYLSAAREAVGKLSDDQIRNGTIVAYSQEAAFRAGIEYAYRRGRIDGIDEANNQ